MRAKNPSYSGLYGSNSIELERDLLHIYPFGVIGDQFKGKVRLHAHPNLIQIFYIERGKTILHANKSQHEVEGPVVIFVPRNHAHGFEHLESVKGWIFSVSDLTLAHRFQLDAPILQLIDDLHITPLATEHTPSERLKTTMQNCINEYQGSTLGRALMLQTLVYQVIVLICRLQEPQTISSSRSQTKAEKIFRQFRQAVKQSYNYRKSVESFADELGISVNYLHKVCKERTNRPPKELIIDFFINESKHLLQDINKPVSQISYELNFEDPAYFTRIFKKKTGMTPKAFREMLFP